jgi:outer membrane scaffolding protein for murein synthesis (MipA/OmpV family)
MKKLTKIKLSFFAISFLMISNSFVDISKANDFLADAESEKSGVRGFIGFGMGMVNEYEGSEDYQLIPFLGGRINQDNRYIELLGLGARANLLNDENWQIGPALRFRFGRDSDVDNNKVALLDELDKRAKTDSNFDNYNIAN